jgi:hypothetical protein
MGSWLDSLQSQHTYRYLPPVYSRDFAYANNAPVVLAMARANINDINAKTFAEYVTLHCTVFT